MVSHTSPKDMVCCLQVWVYALWWTGRVPSVSWQDRKMLAMIDPKSTWSWISSPYLRVPLWKSGMMVDVWPNMYPEIHLVPVSGWMNCIAWHTKCGLHAMSKTRVTFFHPKAAPYTFTHGCTAAATEVPFKMFLFPWYCNRDLKCYAVVRPGGPLPVVPTSCYHYHLATVGGQTSFGERDEERQCRKFPRNPYKHHTACKNSDRRTSPRAAFLSSK